MKGTCMVQNYVPQNTWKRITDRKVGHSRKHKNILRKGTRFTDKMLKIHIFI